MMLRNRLAATPLQQWLVAPDPGSLERVVRLQLRPSKMLVSTVLDLTVAAHQEAGVVERAFLVARLGLKAHGMHTHILLGGSKHQRVQKVIQRRIRFFVQLCGAKIFV